MSGFSSHEICRVALTTAHPNLDLPAVAAGAGGWFLKLRQVLEVASDAHWVRLLMQVAAGGALALEEALEDAQQSGVPVAQDE